MKHNQSKQNVIARHWPALIAIAVLWLLLAVIYRKSLGHTHGNIVYALDDAYIHMAIAKNLADHGVWGINGYEFASASSSLLWTLILSAIYKLFGTIEIVPLVLNVMLATVAVLVAHIILSRRSLPRFYEMIVLVAFVLLTSLPSLVFTGMEHVLQIIAAILFVCLAADSLARGSGAGERAGYIWLCVLALALPMIRYEGIFLVLVVCVLYLLRGRCLHALLLGFLAIIPVSVFGLISIHQGSFFLPNSLLLKSGFVGGSMAHRVLSGLTTHIITLGDTSFMLMLLLVATAAYVLRFRVEPALWEPEKIALAALTGTTLLHALFAQTGWFFRYEAYLIGLGVVVVGRALKEFVPTARQLADKDPSQVARHVAVAMLLFVVFVPFLWRARRALTRVPRATTNIYEQQYQMALFLRYFYKGCAVGANDVGAISALADIRCVDLWGLGNLEVTRKKIRGYYGRGDIEELAKISGMRIAIVYDSWFDKLIPHVWVRVGQWTISNNVVCGGETVSFYAIAPKEKGRLVDCLRCFSRTLPRSVKQSGLYVD